tara:strand:+ start:447 stop:617 length:171 start_codon:yes stop_codon:yes gene_type:complete
VVSNVASINVVIEKRINVISSPLVIDTMASISDAINPIPLTIKPIVEFFTVYNLKG